VKWWDLGMSGARTSADGARVPAGTPTTTQLYEFTLPSITPKVQESGSGGERRMMVMVSQPMWQMEVYQGILPTGGLAFVNEKDYRVNVTSPVGAIERVIERPFKAKKATEKDKELALERRRENMRNNTTGAIRVSSVNGRQSFSSGASRNTEIPSIEEMLRTTQFEETIPVVRGLRTDPQGRVWIARMPADFGQQGPVDILRANGSYVGTLASARLPDAVSRTGRAAYIERDDLGVEHVAVRRLPANWQ
jgi:hypothetical protein